MRIISVHASCSCTSSELQKYTLNPWETTDLKLTTTVPRSYSKAQLSCILKTDAENFPDWTYVLTFESIPRLMVDPSRVYLGTFKASDFDANGRPYLKTEATHLAVDVFNRGAEADMVCPKIVGAGEELAVTFAPCGPPHSIGRSIWHLKYDLGLSLVRLSESSTTGMKSRFISIATSDGEVAGVVVSWRMASPIEAVPSFLSLRPDPSGREGGTRRLLLRSSPERPFRIAKIEVTSSVPTDKIMIKPVTPAKHEDASAAHAVDIAIGLPTTGGPRMRSGVIRAITDDPDQKEVVVPWSAARNAPAGR